MFCSLTHIRNVSDSGGGLDYADMEYQGLETAAMTAVVDALRLSQQLWAVAKVRGDRAWVMPAPSAGLLARYLSQVDARWELDWHLEQAEPPIVRASLSIGGVRRAGLGRGHSLRDAKLLALADAALAFGVPTAEGQWVAYDPEDGADTALLEAEATAQAEAAASRLSLRPERPKDPQREKAKAHIDDLITQLREAGRGKEITSILLRGYGETVEESREIYRELQAVLRRQA